MDQKFIDKIEDLRHNTYSRIVDMQKHICPMVRKLYMNYQFEYWYDGYKYNIWEDNVHLYAVNELPWCYDNELKNTVFIDTLDNLVAQDKIWPFLMFIDGVAIQWSKITIIHDYDYTYLRVDDIAPDYSFYTDIVVFPLGSKKIRYGEDRDVLVTPDRKGFYFGTDGKRLESTDFVDISIRLEILDDNIYYKEVNVDQIRQEHKHIIEFEDLPDGYIPTLSNIIGFDEEGKFIHDPRDIDIHNYFNGAYGLFKLQGSPLKWAILMYNMDRTNKSVSYLYDRSEDFNRKSIVDLFIEESEGPDPQHHEIWQDIITPLIDTFDFDHEFGVDYETNIANAAEYISKYDFRLWRDVFANKTNIKSFTFTGKEFKQYSDGKGYIRLSRKHTDLIEDVVMMFVNNKLYEYSIDIYYTTNTINIPIFGIYDDDHVEIVMFTECNNNILDIVVPDENTSVYIHPEYDLDNCYIMADYHPNSEYDVPEDLEGRRQYIVDCTYTKLENGNFKIKFKEPDYYGKNLKIVPKRQFRYYRYKQRDDQYRIILPTQFNYCHNPDQYMIFVNGKKIDQFGDMKFVKEEPAIYRSSEINITISQNSDTLSIDFSNLESDLLHDRYRIKVDPKEEDFDFNSGDYIDGAIDELEDYILELDWDSDARHVLFIVTYEWIHGSSIPSITGLDTIPIEVYISNSAKSGEYAITIMNKNRPFSKLVLYLSTILDPGDYVDIFYIPEVIVEKYKQLKMKDFGLILLEDEEGEDKTYPTTYPLSKYTSMVFINGLKVNPLDIKDMSLNSLLINVDKYNRDEDGNPISESRHYIDSLDNVTIMEYVVGDEEVAQYIRIGTEYQDNWKKLITTILDKYSHFDDPTRVDTRLQDIFGKLYRLESPAENYKDRFTNLRSILYDMVIEYYLDKHEINTGSPFTYDFRRETWKPNVDQDLLGVVKLITLVPNHDKLLDYESIESNATTSDVQDGKHFLPPD